MGGGFKNTTFIFINVVIVVDGTTVYGDSSTPTLTVTPTPTGCPDNSVLKAQIQDLIEQLASKSAQIQ